MAATYAKKSKLKKLTSNAANNPPTINHRCKALDELQGFLFAKYFACILHACKVVNL